MTRTLIAATLLTPLLLATASAQTIAPSTAADDRWSPYLGCWRPGDDAAASGARICVTPAGAGVTLTTYVAGQTVSTDTRVADGVARPVDVNGCRGSETARWSEVGQRLYRTATVTCDSGAPRTLKTASFFVAGPAWVDVETVDDAGTINVRVNRLVRAASPRLPAGAAAPPAVTPRAPSAATLAHFTVADVIDLSSALPPDGVQAAIAEAPTPFRLNKGALEQLAAASVGERVIDLMVGVTYPQKFQVRAMSSGGGGMGGGGFGGFGSGMADPFFSPIVGGAALYGCNSPYAWAGSAYWGNCAYIDPSLAMMYPGYYNGYWGGFGPGWVVTQPGTGVIPSPGGGEPQGDGRVVNGRGYTQVQPVVNASTMPSDGGSSISNGGGNTAGGSSGGVSGSGYSGGGASVGGGGGDRTAVPRGPGGR